MKRSCMLLAALFLAFSTYGLAQAKAGDITKSMRTLRTIPDDKRGAKNAELAAQIRELPPGKEKVALAVSLCGFATEGDFGKENLQAVTNTLAMALAETPIPDEHGKPAYPYMELANITRYLPAKTDLKSPELERARQILIANEEDVQKADFMLEGLNLKKKIKLSELRGKVVMVNFWATWCPPCKKEMPALDALQQRFKNQDMLILAITQENSFKVAQWFSGLNYAPTVLFDPDGKVHKQFHVTGIPKTFVFDRNGKLVAQSIDEMTMGQMLGMLSKTDLHN